MKHINFVNFITALLVVVGIAVSVYFLVGYTNKAEDVQGAQIAQCERGLAKSLILINFMNEAAATRRASAEGETDPIKAANNLKAAEKYEGFAKDFDKLTPKNCLKEVSNPTAP